MFFDLFAILVSEKNLTLTWGLSYHLKRNFPHGLVTPLEAMESLLRRWDRCAESRRQLVETQVGQVLGEAREMVEEVKISDVLLFAVGTWKYTGNTWKY